MRKEVLDDLELMRKIRDERVKKMEEAEAEMKEINRIEVEGIKNFDELVFYIRKTIQGAGNYEVQARDTNNVIMYAEATGVKREMKNLLNLILKGDEEDKNLNVWGYNREVKSEDSYKEVKYGMEVI